MTVELRNFLREQIDLGRRRALREELVSFCVYCYEPFDHNPDARGRPRTVCKECKRALAAKHNRAYRARLAASV